MRDGGGGGGNSKMSKVQLAPATLLRFSEPCCLPDLTFFSLLLLLLFIFLLRSILHFCSCRGPRAS